MNWCAQNFNWTELTFLEKKNETFLFAVTLIFNPEEKLRN